MSHPKHPSVLLKGDKCHDRDSNPHSADQKHKSLNPVVLTTSPGHATNNIPTSNKVGRLATSYLGPISQSCYAQYEVSSLIKTGLPTQFPRDFQHKQTTANYQKRAICNKRKFWLVILFLSRMKFHAKQIFVLSGSMKLGPVPTGYPNKSRANLTISTKSAKKFCFGINSMNI